MAAMADTTQSIQGEILQVTYRSPDSAYCILKVQTSRIKPQTVLGDIINPQPGQAICADGEWVMNAQYGKQFKATQITTTAPKSKEAIIKYLSSGIIPGIGEKYARLLYNHGGDQILEIIEKNPKRIARIPGIGKKRANAIHKAWQGEAILRETLLFLYTHGISENRALRIYRKYGAQSIESIQENPYRLYTDIHGIGFKTADQIALSLGMVEDDPVRIAHAVIYLLDEAAKRGHTACERQELLDNLASKLGLAEELLQEQLEAYTHSEHIKEISMQDQTVLYLKRLYFSETHSAEHLKRLCSNINPMPSIQESMPHIENLEKYLGYSLSAQQKSALKNILTQKVSILTGGPGVGKTTLVQSLVRVLQQHHKITLLCAPTGKAAKRLRETTGVKATTIHRALGIDPVSKQFLHHQNNPLKVEYCIVDESSMIDITLFAALLKALPSQACVLFVGDVDQLPSVGPGAVLYDMIQTQRISVIALTEIFRQAQTSYIIRYAHQIRQAKMPSFEQISDDCDCYFIEREDDEACIKTLETLITQRIPQKFGLEPKKDIQILCPMHKGKLGTVACNEAMQSWLHSSTPDRHNSVLGFRIGDKVIQLRNNYDKDVFNGDSGFIMHIDPTQKTLEVQFDDSRVSYYFDELDELQLAYAISIHKSQGSEFPCVILPISTSQYMMLEKNLIYTAMTRGKKLLIFVGQKKALRLALQKTGSQTRNGFLKDHIDNLFI